MLLTFLSEKCPKSIKGVHIDSIMTYFFEGKFQILPSPPPQKKNNNNRNCWISCNFRFFFPFVFSSQRWTVTVGVTVGVVGTDSRAIAEKFFQSLPDMSFTEAEDGLTWRYSSRFIYGLNKGLFNHWFPLMI